MHKICMPADAPPGLRRVAARSVACRAGQMTVTPGTPGTWGTWGCTSTSPYHSPNFFCCWGTEVLVCGRETTLRSAISRVSSSSCSGVRSLSCRPSISVPMCVVRSVTLVAAPRRLFLDLLGPGAGVLSGAPLLATDLVGVVKEKRSSGPVRIAVGEVDASLGKSLACGFGQRKGLSFWAGQHRQCARRSAVRGPFCRMLAWVLTRYYITRVENEDVKGFNLMFASL